MLLKKFGAAARRMTQAAIWKILHRKPMIYRVLPTIFKASYKLDVVIGRTALPLARNPIYRAAQLFIRSGRAFRPFSSLAIHHRRLQQDRPHLHRFSGFLIKKRDTVGVVERIRDVFSTNARYNADLARATYPNNIDAYEIGQNIGYGCNAAVYALKIRDAKDPLEAKRISERLLSDAAAQPSARNYPLALKLMYNFALDMSPRLGDNHLWSTMGAELVPLPESAKLLKGRMGRFQPLPSFHPNVVRVLTAFVDRMPILEDAKLVYPDALPSAPFYEMIISEPRTMFVVMKRYRMTLREYVKDFKRRRSYHVARVLLGQLLEGCVFLFENTVSQRDMKSDNILLEFNCPNEVPQLVISDFGCALATGSWLVKYGDDSVDLGGNRKTRAPEIVCAVPGPDSVVDFRMADTWAAGTLAYEIFTRVNPFYSRLDSANYKEEELPSLARVASKPVRNAVYQLLRRDPQQRTLPHIAANVISLSLLRLGGDFQTILSASGLNNIANIEAVRNSASSFLEKLAISAEKVLDDALFLMSAETIAAHAAPSELISRAEQQLRATFFSRLNRDHVWEAVSFFLPEFSVHTVGPDEQSPSTVERNRRRIMSGLKKRSPPVNASSRIDGTDDAPIPPTSADKHSSHDITQQPITNFRGRRTYSEVVVESLDGDKCIDGTSSISDAEVPQSSRLSRTGSDLQVPDHVNYYYGNPFVEKTDGILHFYKYNDERLGREVQCRMLCMLAVPAQLTLRELLLFIGPEIGTIERIKIIRDATPNEYMVILKFKTHNDAVVFYDEFNGTRFNSLETNQCRLLFVDRIECASEDEVAALCSGKSGSSDGAASSTAVTELPTCAVCLERMDDSVVSILCNHTFHAGCLEQWTDTTCPVCRYIQTPELVAEQRCSVCGQSSDLWICLICGNIGCGRYAEGHAYMHFELTSHTFCLQVGGQRVWDYAGDNYVHRLIQSDTEGKVVEYQRGGAEGESEEKKDKLDGIKLEYTCLLTSQLESQRLYFEARLADMERAMNNMEKMAQAQIDDLEQKLSTSTSECKDLRKQMEEVTVAKQANEKKHSQAVNKLSKVTAELKAEREMNEMLRADQQLWKTKVSDLEKKCITCEQQFSVRINELQQQVSDLMLHFDAQAKIQAQLDSAQVSREEIDNSHVGVTSTTPEKKQRRKNKK
ncbi:unnamed protein product [Nippostrongylus brasiliensis]|uniref:Protein kinase domain-containing protein n=1 Tax=Nippostrongylus brasiliensis TaxID=27835 RepID=A0A158R3E2_NIPBR|nr:unnamed protein product [Nippostrongylus brasiliensis]